MTYGFRPENWPVFKTELEERGIAVSEIERVEIRRASVPSRLVCVTVTLRSGRVDSWTQPESEVA